MTVRFPICLKRLQTPPTSRADAHRICRYCDAPICGHAQDRCPVARGVGGFNE